MKRDYITTALREEQRARSDAADSMPVKRGCICPNGGEPDARGLRHFCPACLCPGHGLRSLYLVHDESFGGFFRVVEEPPRSKPAQHRVRLPINSEPLSADARLTEAMRKYGQRLAARVNQ